MISRRSLDSSSTIRSPFSECSALHLIIPPDIDSEFYSAALVDDERQRLLQPRTRAKLCIFFLT
jgi:hypothetical protein